MKNNYNLLLIEDNLGDARLISEMLILSKISYEVTVCDTLGKGVKALLEKNFDIILLDLSLSDSYGIDTIQRIKVEASNIAIVVLTGLNDDTIVDLVVKAGAQDYLPKESLDAPLLLRSIRYAMERNQLLSELRNLSLFDELTGLYNRRGFFTLAQHQFKIAKRSKKSFLLFFMDIDKMKWINDNLGHQVGDQALVDAATILRNVFRDTDIVARLGGDEFVVLAIDANESLKTKLLFRLQYKLDENKGKPYQLAMSVGVVSYDSTEEYSLEDLLNQADVLMYRDKQSKYLHRNLYNKNKIL